MLNGQLRPGYNVQISTLVPHVERFKKQYDRLPENITADAGYGSQENYTFLEDNEVEAFVKYNYFHKEQRTKKADEPGRVENLFYNKEQDCFYCPTGRQMKKIGSYKKKTDMDFEQEYMRYQAKNCENCPLRSVCHKSKGNRIIDVNHELIRLKAKAKKLLLSEEGIKHRKQRPADVEPVFGNVKQNKPSNDFCFGASKSRD